jgi:hypothetical protein
MTMNRRDFLKSLAATAAALSLPFPDLAFAEPEAPEIADEPAPILDDNGRELVSMSLVHRLHHNEHFMFGSRAGVFTIGATELILTRKYRVNDNTVEVVKSRYSGVPTTQTIERVRDGDYSEFIDGSWDSEFV